jgi:hypothetical protein
MDDRLAPDVLAYLVPAGDAFWRWEAGGAAAVWQSGATICFAAELRAMLSPFNARPLPPLDMLLLVAAATRENWRIASRASLAVDAWRVAQYYLTDDQCSAVHSALERLSFWSSDLRVSQAAKRAIADSVFQESPPSAGGPADGPADGFAADVMAAVEGGVPEAVWAFEGRGRMPAPTNCYSLRTFLAGLQALEPAAVRHRMATGLDNAPTAAPAELASEIVERTRALMHGPFDDELLAAMAGIARQLLGVVALPLPMALRETLLDGGFADISNRGTPDRLLQSELAHDDLTFTTRLALGESLYLRRESLPPARARRRSILVDAGIRLWGVPRVFAAAVTLAFAATADRLGGLRIYRADGASVAPVAVESAAGWTGLLAGLSPHPHPGESLSAWSLASRLGEEDSEAILVTARSVWEDEEFRVALRNSGPARLHVAIVDRAGRFELIRWSEAGQRSLRQAQLDLTALLDQRTCQSVHDPKLSDELPAIFRAAPFPLRVWSTCKYQRDRAATFRTGGYVQATSDRRLMYWDCVDRPPIQLYEGLPKGRLLGHERTPDGRVLRAVFGNPGAPRLYAVDADLIAGTARLRSFQSTIAWPEGFQWLGQDLLVVGCCHRNGYHDRRSIAVEALDWETLDRIDYLQRTDVGILWPLVPGLVGYEEHAGRREFFHLSLQGLRISTTPIDTTWLPNGELATLFRRPGADGFCGFTRTGYFVETLNGRRSPIPHLTGNVLLAVEVAAHGMSACCHGVGETRFMVDLPLDGPPRVLDPHDSEWLAFGPGWNPHLHARTGPLGDKRATRWRRRRLLRRVAVDRHRIWLQADTGLGFLPGLELALNRAELGSMRWMGHNDDLKSAAARQDLHTFEWVADKRYSAYRLRKARCGGLDVFLDDRGLLHLRDPRGRQLELTLLVQKQGPPTAWRSDGRRYGDQRFHFPDGQPFGSMEELETSLRELMECAHV